MASQTATLPPGPPSAAVWQLIRYSNSPLPFLESCARRYGEAFTIKQAGFGKLVVLSNPLAVRDVFRGDPHVLHSGEGNEFLSLTVGKTSVLVLDEAAHARQRKILLPPLKGERMRSFFSAMQAATRETMQTLPTGQPVRIDHAMRAITRRVISQAVFGLPPGPELEDFERKVDNMLAFGRHRYALLLTNIMPHKLLESAKWVPFYKQKRQLDEAIHKFTNDLRQQAPEARQESIVADLLAATHDDGSPICDEEIRDAVVTLLIAGHETTSIALAWALEQMVPRRDVQEAIKGELAEVTGSGQPQADHLPHLNYLDAAIRESLRVRTILPFVVRLTKQPFVAAGREYPAGVLLTPCNHLVHRRVDLYPEPERFRPERFLEHKFAGHEWFPFGGGNRTCLGIAFALYEMKVVLSTLFSEYEMERPPYARSRYIRSGLTLAPSDGVQLILHRKVKR